MNKNQDLTVQGYRFAAVSSGLKKNRGLDLGLIMSEKPAVCAGVFTRNKIVAAPVELTVPRIRSGRCQAILVNSKNANACTGEQGLRDAAACSAAVASALGIDENMVAISSTGVIGQRLDVEKIRQAVPHLVENLAENEAGSVAEAIMTTDSFAKIAMAHGSIGGTDYSILGLAKGAGMIHPDMATMLAFIVTDVAASREFLDKTLRTAVDASFNRITVDRDTSTNDMALLLANGAASVTIEEETDAASEFVKLLQEVLLDLARMIVRDGEGATKLVRIQVIGAENDDDALVAAEAIATSSLVKTAFFGEDANWGRIIAAAGYSGAAVDPDKIDIRVGEVPLAENGLAGTADQEAAATEVMRQSEFTVTVDLKLGTGEAYYYTSDLTYDYVRINADYRT